MFPFSEAFPNRASFTAVRIEVLPAPLRPPNRTIGKPFLVFKSMWCFPLKTLKFSSVKELIII